MLVRPLVLDTSEKRIGSQQSVITRDALMLRNCRQSSLGGQGEATVQVQKLILFYKGNNEEIRPKKWFVGGGQMSNTTRRVLNSFRTARGAVSDDAAVAVSAPLAYQTRSGLSHPHRCECLERNHECAMNGPNGPFTEASPARPSAPSPKSARSGRSAIIRNWYAVQNA
ncbi:hypothetical protein PHSY_001737 [Pseudozyma hubeiensis SY62]|uniref:Uncharacterized protein n=1 Tax=Pseudozyma hubeiensis (strain SY62) TaxID=1305764 RepID=R9NZG6_PSEHS|nr:hypothetical protein PHSY_001737 [Pseudozyma hubeiensis SY62]GAC94166.1 hypothetical protein PHSY_001737 [Pseudozyma hubeiensis SY62]